MHSMYFFFTPFIKYTDTEDKLMAEPSLNVKGYRDGLEYMMQHLLGEHELSQEKQEGMRKKLKNDLP